MHFVLSFRALGTGDMYTKSSWRDGVLTYYVKIEAVPMNT